MQLINHPEYVRKGIEIYLEKGKFELLEYLKKSLLKNKLVSNSNPINFKIYCPSCGKGFSHSQIITGKLTGGLGGMATGAYFGAQIGIAGGPFGAIAGTIPGAILGAFFGKNIGSNFDKPTCPNCKTNFQMPKNPQIIQEVDNNAFENEIQKTADYIIFLSTNKTALHKQKLAQELNESNLKKAIEKLRNQSKDNEK